MARRRAEPEQAPTVTQPAPTVTGHRGLQHAKLAVMRAVAYIQKKQPDKQAKDGLKYSYAAEEAIVQAIHDACLEAGLTVTPLGVRIKHHGVFVTARGTPMNHVILINRYRLTHADTGECEEGESTGEAMDAGDKACNKASTGAYKYFFRQAFVIPTGDDPDATDSRTMERPAEERPARKPLKGKDAPAKAKEKDNSFELCLEAIGRAPSVEVLDRYRDVYKRRDFHPDEMVQLDEAYDERKRALQAASPSQDAKGDAQPPQVKGAGAPKKAGEVGGEAKTDAGQATTAKKAGTTPQAATSATPKKVGEAGEGRRTPPKGHADNGAG